ncbi:hypothetical protein PY254_07125 [Rhodanobacter sp. AS-Z3]|uniref:hypothetical protein n=1 Tax=Rhodanobacter sp. AS-Z3 TaxID=3031330 RepID=UPI00247B1563|nr:hypothetical protein [Rhodanobacter sp. AS-Z3]WEN16426.1 hypothetical protein PY254_07125 [Rhodanobacter sp. AS-Z3]
MNPWTLAGLALLLLPLLTMAHEVAGHALACVATGHMPSEIGAYYVECPNTGPWARRIVAMAGTGMDVLLAVLALIGWHRVRRPLPRLVLWLVFTVKGMVAAGYWMFSGVSNLGDWGPDVGGGIGPLPWPWLWRVVLFAVGLFFYIVVTRRAIRMLGAMLGGGEPARQAQRRIAMTIYLIGGVSAVLVSMVNPLGIVITLISAVASTFGGTAGLFNVAYAKPRDESPRDFVIGRHQAIIVAGVLMMLAFATVLGPTLYLH